MLHLVYIFLLNRLWTKFDNNRGRQESRVTRAKRSRFLIGYSVNVYKPVVRAILHSISYWERWKIECHARNYGYILVGGDQKRGQGDCKTDITSQVVLEHWAAGTPKGRHGPILVLLPGRPGTGAAVAAARSRSEQADGLGCLAAARGRRPQPTGTSAVSALLHIALFVSASCIRRYVFFIWRFTIWKHLKYKLCNYNYNGTSF